MKNVNTEEALAAMDKGSFGISGNSGHYQPTLDDTKKALEVLQKSGVADERAIIAKELPVN